MKAERLGESSFTESSTQELGFSSKCYGGEG